MEVLLAPDTAQPLGTDGYFHFYSIRENPVFWDTNSRDLAFFSKMRSWNMPCGNASATHATDLAEQWVEMMCVPMTSMVHCDLRRGSFTCCFVPPASYWPL